MPNRFTPINTSSPLPSALNQVNQNFAKLDNEGVTKVYNGPGGTKAVVQGRLPDDAGYGQALYDQNGNAVIYMAVKDDGNAVLKVAKTNKDAISGTGNDLIFNSGQNTFKIVASGSASLTSPNSAGSSLGVSVYHGLGYAPIVMAFVKFSSGGTSFPIPYLGLHLTGVDIGKVWYQISFEALGDYITFYHRNVTAPVNQTVTITYYILQETSDIN